MGKIKAAKEPTDNKGSPAPTPEKVELAKTEPLTEAPLDTRQSISIGSMGVELNTLDKVWRMADGIIKGGFAPKGMTKIESVMVAIQYGMEVGLSPMAAVSNIAVINGRPSLWGDALPGLVEASGLMEWKTQKLEGEGEQTVAIYTSKRVGNPDPIVTRFSVDDAKRAKLWMNKDKDPWIKYPFRMLMNRARAFNLRDNFPDVLKGLTGSHEAQDIPITATTDDQPRGIAGLEKTIEAQSSTAPPNAPIAPSDTEAGLEPPAQPEAADAPDSVAPVEREYNSAQFAHLWSRAESIGWSKDELARALAENEWELVDSRIQEMIDQKEGI